MSRVPTGQMLMKEGVRIARGREGRQSDAQRRLTGRNGLHLSRHDLVPAELGGPASLGHEDLVGARASAHGDGKERRSSQQEVSPRQPRSGGLESRNDEPHGFGVCVCEMSFPCEPGARVGRSTEPKTGWRGSCAAACLSVCAPVTGSCGFFLWTRWYVQATTVNPCVIFSYENLMCDFVPVNLER